VGEHERKDDPKDKADYEPKHAKDPDNTPTQEIPKVKDGKK
jgi:hypothetical protein